jgi:DNA-binding transcriptional ArsR family regulator
VYRVDNDCSADSRGIGGYYDLVMAPENNLLPLTPSVDISDEQPRTVDMLTEEGIRMLNALGSETARKILAVLREEPATTSDVADQVGMTVQTVHYHMEQFKDAGLIRVVSTHYSSRGSEMDVHAIDGTPLILVCGDMAQITSAGDSVDSFSDERSQDETVTSG